MSDTIAVIRTRPPTITETVIATFLTRLLLDSPLSALSAAGLTAFGSPGVLVLMRPGTPGVGERDAVEPALVVGPLTGFLVVLTDGALDEVETDEDDLVVVACEGFTWTVDLVVVVVVVAALT